MSHDQQSNIVSETQAPITKEREKSDWIGDDASFLR